MTELVLYRARGNRFTLAQYARNGDPGRDFHPAFVKTTHMTSAGQLNRYRARTAASARTLIRAVIYANKYSPVSISIVAIFVLAVYAIMFGNYRPHTSIDTQWSLSYSYNFCVKGIDTDPTFGAPFPIGQGGTVAFGKLAAMVQCASLAPFNWSLVAA